MCVSIFFLRVLKDWIFSFQQPCEQSNKLLALVERRVHLLELEGEAEEEVPGQMAESKGTYYQSLGI